jgi:radical SAM superfamily enzyme YgiQ (UPF0313 family)
VKHISHTPIILGGIYATLYKEHAEKNTNADFIYEGQIDDRLIKVIENFGLKLEKINNKPKYWWQMNFYKEMPYAPILTSTGCPFRCSYCASSLLYNSFEQRNIDEVADEIEGLYRLGVRDFAFYDDALLYKADTHTDHPTRTTLLRRTAVRPHATHRPARSERLLATRKNTTTLLRVRRSR